MVLSQRYAPARHPRPLCSPAWLPPPIRSISAPGRLPRRWWHPGPAPAANPTMPRAKHWPARGLSSNRLRSPGLRRLPARARAIDFATMAPTSCFRACWMKCGRATVRSSHSNWPGRWVSRLVLEDPGDGLRQRNRTAFRGRDHCRIRSLRLCLRFEEGIGPRDGGRYLHPRRPCRSTHAVGLLYPPQRRHEPPPLDVTSVACSHLRRAIPPGEWSSCWQPRYRLAA